MDTAGLQRLVDAQAASQSQLSAMAAAAAAAQLRGFTGSWWDTAAVTALAARIVGQVQGVQRQAAAVTDAYLARVLTVLRGRAVAPVGPIGVQALRGGVTHADVYGRLADQYRWLRTQQLDDAQALHRVITRAQVVADTDTVLAARAQARTVMVVRKVDAYRRVIRPELAAGGTCGLCIVAADRVYGRGDLLPIHDRCNCTVLPIIWGADPGHALNRDELNALYAAAGSNRAADLKKTRYKIHHHGELGPVLADADHNFRGPSDVAA